MAPQKRPRKLLGAGTSRCKTPKRKVGSGLSLLREENDAVAAAATADPATASFAAATAGAGAAPVAAASGGAAATATRPVGAAGGVGPRSGAMRVSGGVSRAPTASLREMTTGAAVEAAAPGPARDGNQGAGGERLVSKPAFKSQKVGLRGGEGGETCCVRIHSMVGLPLCVYIKNSCPWRSRFFFFLVREV